MSEVKKCDKCQGETFASEKEYQLHLCQSHYYVDDIKCPFCSYSSQSRSKNDLNSHLKTKHKIDFIANNIELLQQTIATFHNLSSSPLVYEADFSSTHLNQVIKTNQIKENYPESYKTKKFKRDPNPKREKGMSQKDLLRHIPRFEVYLKGIEEWSLCKESNKTREAIAKGHQKDHKSRVASTNISSHLGHFFKFIKQEEGHQKPLSILMLIDTVRLEAFFTWYKINKAANTVANHAKDIALVLSWMETEEDFIPYLTFIKQAKSKVLKWRQQMRALIDIDRAKLANEDEELKKGKWLKIEEFQTLYSTCFLKLFEMAAELQKLESNLLTKESKHEFRELLLKFRK